MKTLTLAGMALGGVLLFAGCSDEPKSVGNKSGTNSGSGTVVVKQATPEEAATSFQDGVRKKDWGKSFACLTDESQNALLKAAADPARLVTGVDSEERKSLDALLRRHGAENDVAGAKNKAALFSGLLEWLAKNAALAMKTESLEFLDLFRKIKTASFRRSGETATADALLDGKKIRTIYFLQMNGKWYIDFVRTKNSRTPLPFPPAPR